MKIEQDIKLDFDDVLIKPKRSESPSRADVLLPRQFKYKYSPVQFFSCIPIIASNMDTTGSIAMAKSLAKLECLTALHKFYPLEKLVNHWTLSGVERHTFYSMGMTEQDDKKFQDFLKAIHPAYPQFINIDIANGYNQKFVKFCAKIRELSPFSVIMAGNVATPEMSQELVIGGKVDIVKVGIGPGSVCLTRLKTGVGYPQLSAISECADVVHGLNAHICADGGCKRPDHVCKAIGAGADFVMIGGMLAGTDECEGEWNYIDLELVADEIYENKGYKFQGKTQADARHNFKKCIEEAKLVAKKNSLKFHGMSSKEAMDLYSGGMADYKCAEGEEIVVNYKGKAEEIIKDILGGLRSCGSMIGAETLKDIPKCCTFIRVNRTK